MSRTERRTFLQRAALLAGGGLIGGWRLVPAGGAAAAAGPLRELAGAVRGPLLTPADPGYVAARPGYNLAGDANRPLAVLQALDANDVAAAIRWAAKHRKRIAARSGGHSYASYSTPDGGLVVDLRRMRGLSMRNGRLRVAAGAQLIDVHAFLAPKGLVLPTGSCPSVGVSGLTLGGGVGLRTRQLGLTCDRLRAVEIVTADGVLRRADATNEVDLFWALRGGGGGNFGIATAFEFAPAASRSAAWFTIRWPWSQADAALAAWLRFAPSTDHRLTALLTLSAGHPASVSALGQFAGSEGQLRRLIGPLTRVSGGTVRTGTAGTMDLVRRWAGCLDRDVLACHTVGTRPGGTLTRNRFGAASGYIRDELGRAERAQLLSVIERRARQGGGALIFDPYGGAANAMSPDATAFVHRRERCSVQAYAGFGPSGAAAARAWLASVRAVLARIGSGSAYQNYIDPQLVDWQRAYYGENLARLREVAGRYDPGRVFVFPQAVAAA